MAVLRHENLSLRARIRELHTARTTGADSAQRLRNIISKLQKELEVERSKNLRDDT